MKRCLDKVLSFSQIQQDSGVDRKKIWITWEKQRRNQSMCENLGVECNELISAKRGLFRYICLIGRTLSLIIRERPSTLFVQNPSIVLSFLAVVLKPLLRYRLVVDEHNSGIFPLEGSSRCLNAVAKFIARNADAVIVTNTALQEFCEGWGAKVFVVPDPLPKFPGFLRSGDRVVGQKSESVTMLFICTWANDEPYKTVISAAESFDRTSLIIRITGDPKNKIDTTKLPDNVELLGFVPDEEYIKELVNCDGVIVLTTRENCLNCGAYEAVSLEKPGILSDTAALRSHFSKGFTFTSPWSEQRLVQSIKQFIVEREHLEIEVGLLRMELASDTAPFEKIKAEFLF
jgi:glycosyltransferase involved in cell wall biosynthesis